MAIPNRSPLNFFGENGAWAYPGAFQFFGYPLSSQERVKLQTSKFGESIYRANPNKSP